LDAELSLSLAVWLSRRFKLEAVAVNDVGLTNAEDHEIFDAARKADVIVLRVEKGSSPPDDTGKH
jgi:predicted nuclease of predicted toxin-antitoxin system